MFNRMLVERRNTVEEIIRLVYFMRGAIQYKDMLMTTPVERQAIGSFVSKRLEAESKKMYQNY